MYELRKSGLLSEAPFDVPAAQEDKTSHTRQFSERVKKKMKMADLRTFVETKILSKSDKNLERIGKFETEPLEKQVS